MPSKKIGIKISARKNALQIRVGCFADRASTHAASSVGQKSNFRCSHGLSLIGANTATSGDGKTSYKKCRAVPPSAATIAAIKKLFFNTNPPEQTICPSRQKYRRTFSLCKFFAFRIGAEALLNTFHKKDTVFSISRYRLFTAFSEKICYNVYVIF